MYLEGPAVGIGYYNQEDLTKRSFVKNNTINENSGDSIIYKTGDLVSLEDDNKLYIHGRIDNQIKHMGYRIELEEIENALMMLSEVKQALCIYAEYDGINHIVGIIAADTEINTMEIKRELAKYLPKYMIPTKYKITNELLKNKNGKIDRIKYKKESL